ncbi:MAG: proline dehydrogenase family protein [Saprospiraceae bacterium]|nr:proline dehydrogenase family protein [Saprospiraceae bacterium]MBP7679518.1 proline dehydrogenase family protein [Saprospiraceae bacterium]
MNKPWLVKWGSSLGLTAINWRLPFARTIIKSTIFEQFCGGETFSDSLAAINKLAQFNTATVLDYGAEAKESEADFDRTRNETIAAIRFAAQHKTVPLVSTKVTGMARFDLLAKIDARQSLSAAEQEEWSRAVKRVDNVCAEAHAQKIGIFIDAEESWIQEAIDDVAVLMMQRYNREQAIVFDTFQMYRHDRFAYLTTLYERSRTDGYILGAKLVRGAYMEKERKRAAEMGYESPINPSKEDTDRLYNTALTFCIEHYQRMASWNATHNQQSTQLQVTMMHDLDIDKKHPHLNFCQLYGMSDNLTFNLAAAGYNVAKYMPYGTVREVIPYLIRRAQENTAVTGDMSREYQLLAAEMKRRNLH